MLPGEIVSVINDGFMWSGGLRQAIFPGVYAVAGVSITIFQKIFSFISLTSSDLLTHSYVSASSAMVGSVTHTVSTSVIMFEMTGQLVHLLPVLVRIRFYIFLVHIFRFRYV